MQSDGSELSVSFEELNEQSSRVASCLASQGLSQGDRLMVMLPNVRELFEVMLGAMKIGAVIVPVSMLISDRELIDRVERAHIKWIVTNSTNANSLEAIKSSVRKCLVDERRDGFTSYDDIITYSPRLLKKCLTRPTDPLLLYFTSGTTAQPKLVLHSHYSYPVGHLSTMYWIGIREGDIHQNISSPGWAKHAWSSFFAPWTAGATVFVYDYPRFSAELTLSNLRTYGINTLCAPPTVWRMLILSDLKEKPFGLREVVSAGEPLNPEVIERVKESWGLTIRDGYGQTETTAQIGNSPGQHVIPGSMGRALPGYCITLCDKERFDSRVGEIAINISKHRAGLMLGYLDDPNNNIASLDQTSVAEGMYRTGDEASMDEHGYFYSIGRGDDVFKSSDYRISPFELESVLIKHPLVAEAAVVPSSDSLRLCVPKAYVSLIPTAPANARTAVDILNFVNSQVSSYQKIRKIEFLELPKTISGKIRRVELRMQEMKSTAAQRRPAEFLWDDIKVDHRIQPLSGSSRAKHKVGPTTTE